MRKKTNVELGIWGADSIPHSAISTPHLKERTKSFALRIIGLVDGLPAGRTAEVIGRQLLRSGTSVGANYRAACRAKSVADFIAKMGIVEEEADECIYWMELLTEAKILPQTRLQPLMAEADELVAITVSSIKAGKANKSNTGCEISPHSPISIPHSIG